MYTMLLSMETYFVIAMKGEVAVHKDRMKGKISCKKLVISIIGQSSQVPQSSRYL